jgi:hypothetical protein
MAVLRAGISPSHVDCHMGAVFQSAHFYSAYVRAAREFGLGFVAAGDHQSGQSESSGDVSLGRSHLLEVSGAKSTDDWLLRYQDVLGHAPGRIAQLLVHPGFDNAELRAMTDGAFAWGARWRRADFDLVTNPLFRKFLQDRRFILLTWRDLRQC